MRNVSVAIALVLSLELLSSRCEAFDHSRTGFLLGGSTGVGFQNYNAIQPDPTNKLITPAWATSIRLGWGLNNKTEFYLYNGGMTGFDFYYVPIPYTNNVTVAGLRRYLDWPEPGFFVSAGAGLGSATVFAFTAGTGLGLLANVGYEYKRHWSVEVEVTYANLTPVAPFNDPQASMTSAGAIAVKFSGTAY